MAIHLKRIVFFFCILNFGLGCCLGTRANADDNLMYRIFIGMIFNNFFPAIGGRVIFNGSGLPDVEIFNQNDMDDILPGQIYKVAVTDSEGKYRAGFSSHLYFIYPEKYGYQFDPSGSWASHNDGIQDFTAYKHTISGTVLHNGKGLENVEIYGDVYVKDQFVKKLLATTNSNGYYETEENAGLDFTLTAQLSGYEFPTSGIPIIGSEYLHENKDFTAQTAITLSGHVKWNNCVPTQHYCTTPLSNPLPMVAMEAYAEDGSLYSRTATDVDGNYSITIPGGWKGWIKPSRAGFEFGPEKIFHPSFTWEKNKFDFAAPMITVGGGHIYKITVLLIGENGGIPPMSNHVDIQFDGISHAYGSRWKSSFYDTGNYYISWYSGWIGDITPSNDPDLANWPGYTFTPPSFRLNEILTSDLTFTFIAKPK